ncbi:MAG: hypothetical protein QOD63_2767, partial [Actinomycetota bacterium]|nr:hypothetical protein [Actinomycetota bacterium]
MIAVSVFAFVAWGVPHPRARPFAPPPQHFRWLQAWSWWDGAWYVGIARHGYAFAPRGQSSVAFFPAYPLVARAVAVVVGNQLLAAVLVTIGCGAAATTLFYRWCLRWVDRTQARYAVVSLVVYPCAFYLMGAVYADALFLCAALGAFLLLENDRPMAAGLLAALATATRPLGIAVAIGLWLRAHERGHFARPDGSGAAAGRRMGMAGLLLAPAGLVAYCVYLDVRFSHPFAFVQAEHGWGQSPGLSTWLKTSWFRSMARRPWWNAGHAHLAGHAAITLVAICLLPAVFSRFGRAYGVYAAVIVIGAALSTKDFVGMGRYVLSAFPCFVIAGEAAARRPAAGKVGLATSGCLLLVLAGL